jgi:hypothetical protein
MPNQFYLGKLFDLKKGKLLDERLEYDPPDLTTHAVVTGMTGSGKTGLCIDLLEEAALQGIPAIIVDPKGDLTNLVLHFPELRPSDFEPWIDPDAARRAGKSLSDSASETAETWRKGLQDWGLGRKDLENLQASLERTIYTPGSTAGIPVNILASFAAPDLDWGIHQEWLRDKIASTITALLTLVGIKDIDPLRSREHILLSNIVENAWRSGHSLTLQEIILQTQDPPFEHLGTFAVNSFYPYKERKQLALLLNNFLASPSFQTWIEGQSLDAGELLYTKSGKPRHSIFYIAHLDDTERMFFVTLLFTAVEAWMRTQRGTSNLRALVYFDEILGYLPPVANPASKPILIRMVKQARAFGVGLVLTTQNPVDVDYKALSNAGTWMVGRLQTDQDKQRLLDGLESAAGGVPRAEYDRIISALGKRVFLYHNVHEKKPLIFQTRWAMDYLAGPLTLTQIPQLNQLAGVAPFKAGTRNKLDALGTAGTATAAAGTGTSAVAGKPSLPSGVSEYFLPIEKSSEKPTYQPALLAQAEVNYYSRTPNVNFTRSFAVLLPNPGKDPDWENGIIDPVDLRTLPRSPQAGAIFSLLPEHLENNRWWKDRSTEFENWIYETRAAVLYKNRTLNLVSEPEESLIQFKERCRQALAKGDTGNPALDRQRDALERKLEKAQLKVKEYENELRQRVLDEGLRGGKMVLDLVFKRRLRSISPSLTKRRMTSKAQAKLDAAKKELLEVEQQLAGLEGSEPAGTGARSVVDEIQEIRITPSKRDIVIQAFGLAWKPD